MPILAVILGAGGAAFLAAVFYLTDKAMMTGDPLKLLGQLVLDADPIAKLTLLMLFGSLLAITVVGIVRLTARARAPSEALRTASYVCPLAGVAAAGYVLYLTLSVAARLHVTNLAVMAPSLAEGALTAAVGLLAGALAAGLSGRRAPS